MSRIITDTMEERIERLRDNAEESVNEAREELKSEELPEAMDYDGADCEEDDSALPTVGDFIRGAGTIAALCTGALYAFAGLTGLLGFSGELADLEYLAACFLSLWCVFYGLGRVMIDHERTI